MNLLLITFSLRNANKDYSEFFVQLRGHALQWWHFIEQSAIVTTYYDPDEFARLLLPHMETTDSVLVAKIEPHQYQGWLPKEAWEWLEKVSDRAEQDALQPRLPSFLPPPPKP